MIVLRNQKDIRTGKIHSTIIIQNESNRKYFIPVEAPKEDIQQPNAPTDVEQEANPIEKPVEDPKEDVQQVEYRCCTLAINTPLPCYNKDSIRHREWKQRQRKIRNY